MNTVLRRDLSDMSVIIYTQRQYRRFKKNGNSNNSGVHIVFDSFLKIAMRIEGYFL